MVLHRYRQTSGGNQMLGDLQWPTLESRRKRARLCTFYKFHQQLIQINMKHKPSCSCPRRSTCQTHQNTYNLQLHKTTYRQKSFFPCTRAEWTALPASVAMALTQDSFEARVDSWIEFSLFFHSFFFMQPPPPPQSATH